MKKIIVALFCIIALNANSQTTQRLVLVEEVTNASCTPCALSNPAFETLMNANSTKVIPIKYHASFPGYDPFYSANSAQNQARSVYYSVTAVPTARLDGAGTFLQDVNQASIDAEYAVPATMSIALAWKYSSDADSIYITVTFKALQAINGTLIGNIAVIEKAVHYDVAPGSNGEKDFTNVMRKLLPSQTGVPLPTSMVANQTLTFTTGMLITSGFNDISQIGVIAFIQDNATKNVKQAAYAATASVVPVNPIILLSSKGNPVCSNNGSVNISVMGASGAYSYHWSNGATTQDISGLAVGTYAVTVTSGIKTATASYNLTQGALATPTSVITNGITSCSTALNWAALSGASYFQVKYKTASSSIWSSPINVSTTNYVFTGLSASTQYNYSTAGVCANGTAGASASYTATTSSCTIPSNTAAANITASTALISWTAGCNASSYEIQYMISGGTLWTSAISSSTSKTLTGLMASKIYQYKVRTLCGAVYTSFSAVKTFVTPAARIENINEEVAVNIYPNPFESTINISIPESMNSDQEFSIVLFDILGRKILDLKNVQFELGNAKIETSNSLAPGIYLLEIKGIGIDIKKQLVKS
ncbi:hypothetical protein LBMAG27_00800 [Bacteroidota bacterium]|nr:hypothetical protein LBMAG27_00800 [Bacteroidota bacterium]